MSYSTNAIVYTNEKSLPRINIPHIKSVKNKWTNDDVIEFYEKIPIDVLRNWAIEGGFEEGCDIDLAYPYIADTRSLIDLGGGYGRVTNRLITNGYQGKIYIVERSQGFYEHLIKNFSQRANITQQDIQRFSPVQKVEAILWMWSGIGDFSKEEQLPILKQICTWLKPGGTLVLETILHTCVPNNATVNDGRSFVISTKYGTFYGYKASSEEIQEYGEQLGFKYIKHINYLTPLGRPRVVHILSNTVI
ncbi:MAG TPA: class I SAM-dependent methyltransferase [Patescibacteria group bacterium]|nr:class I SAM-dependent methyltransferase [Gammaproteobacteria bacterium]HWA51531.1 class I SAM-dependent methyltransferase [Patescibacteria group bacterium]